MDTEITNKKKKKTHNTIKQKTSKQGNKSKQQQNKTHQVHKTQTKT